MGEKGKEPCKALAQEKEHRNEAYENKVQEAVQELSRLAANGRSGKLEEQVEGILDKVQNLAFMDGYHYALAVLEEGLMNMKA